MRIHETSLADVYLIEPTPIEDDRGFFARVWSDDEFREQGIEATWVQGNLGFSHRAGTLRGLHFQHPPHEEAKLISCPRGELYDVVVDLRLGSPTRWQWIGVEISAKNRSLIYLPPGCAHGYQTLVPDTELLYLTSHRYEPTSASGLRWDDPHLGIEWPMPITLMSEQDRNWPLLDPQEVVS